MHEPVNDVTLPNNLSERVGPVAAVKREVRQLGTSFAHVANSGEMFGVSLQAQVTDARYRHPTKNGLELLPFGPDPVHRRTSPADARRLGLQTYHLACGDLTKHP